MGLCASGPNPAGTVTPAVRWRRAALTAFTLLALCTVCQGEAATANPGGAGSDDSIYAAVDEDGITILSNQPDPAGGYPFHLIVSAPATAAPGRGATSAGTLVPSATVRQWVDEAGRRADIEPSLLLAVIAAESAFAERAISAKGAQGLMQLMPDTARSYGVRDGFDPQANILAGAQYLRALIDRFHGDIRLALAAYNAGSAAVAHYGDRVPPFGETMAYVPRVLALYRRYGGTRYAAAE